MLARTALPSEQQQWANALLRACVSCGAYNALLRACASCGAWGAGDGPHHDQHQGVPLRRLAALIGGSSSWCWLLVSCLCKA